MRYHTYWKEEGRRGNREGGGSNDMGTFSLVIVR